MYLDYYGLRRRPFEGTPDPSFFYYSSAHREALAAIQYGVQQNKGLILISGDVGTGKTTLIQTYLRNVDDSIISIYVDYPFVSMSQLVKYLAGKLGVTEHQAQFPLELIEAITTRLVELKQQGKHVVLIFDEAQHLNTKILEFIRLLSNLQTHEEKLINIALVGQTELLSKIESPVLRQLRQRIVIQRVLIPLDFDETVNYIEHRLLVAGASECPFTRKALKLIFRETRGIPRLVNVLCDNSMLAGFIARSKSITPSIVKRVIRESLPDRHRTPVQRRRLALTLIFLLCIALATGWNIYSGKRLQSDLDVKEPASHYQVDAETLKSSIGVVQIEAEMLKGLRESEALPEEGSEYVNESAGEYGQTVELLSTQANLEPIVKVIETTRGVKPREALLKIIMETYGKSNDTLLDIVQQYNPSLKNIDLVYAGQEIVFPKLIPDTLILKAQDGKYFAHYYSSYQAERVSKKMKEVKTSNLNFSVIAVDQHGKMVYRLYIGPFDTLSDARKIFQILPVDHLPFGGKRN